MSKNLEEIAENLSKLNYYEMEELLQHLCSCGLLTLQLTCAIILKNRDDLAK